MDHNVNRNVVHLHLLWWRYNSTNPPSYPVRTRPRLYPPQACSSQKKACAFAKSQARFRVPFSASLERLIYRTWCWYQFVLYIFCNRHVNIWAHSVCSCRAAAYFQAALVERCANIDFCMYGSGERAQFCQAARSLVLRLLDITTSWNSKNTWYF
jgi:hypothetical protein